MEDKNQIEDKDQVADELQKQIKKDRLKKRIIITTAFLIVFILITSYLATSGIIYFKWYADYKDKKAEKRKEAIANAQDINDLASYIDGDKASYAGKIIEIDGRFGYIDEKLNVKLPVIYDEIEEVTAYDYFNEGAGKKFYKVKRKNEIGILDSDMNFIFEPEYLGIEILENDRYIVAEVDKETGNTVLKLVNGNKDVLRKRDIGYGNIEGVFYLDGANRLKISCKDGDKYYVGILNMNFDTVMNPEYDEINVKYDLADKGEGYYEVIKDNEIARFDGDGRQLWYFKAIESD